MFHFDNQTDQGTEGFFGGGGMRGKMWRDYSLLGLTKENFSFTVPPAVAFLHYLRSGIFRGFSLNIITFAGRISEAAMGRGGGAQRPGLCVKESKTGVRSARARTLGENPCMFKRAWNSMVTTAWSEPNRGDGPSRNRSSSNTESRCAAPPAHTLARTTYATLSSETSWAQHRFVLSHPPTLGVSIGKVPPEGSGYSRTVEIHKTVLLFPAPSTPWLTLS